MGLAWDGWATVVSAGVQGWQRQLWREEPRVTAAERTVPRGHQFYVAAHKRWMSRARHLRDPWERTGLAAGLPRRLRVGPEPQRRMVIEDA